MPDYEYRKLFLPPGTGRESARTTLTIHAQYGEWELARLRLYPDGSRRVVLRRRYRRAAPGYFPS